MPGRWLVDTSYMAQRTNGQSTSRRRRLSAPPRPAAKTWLQRWYNLVARPRWWAYLLMRRFFGQQRAMHWVSESMAHKAGAPGVLYRVSVYQRLLGRVGLNVSIGYGSCFSHAEARLGNDVYIGRHCSIGWVNIADGVRVADGVQLLSGAHQHSSQADQLDIQQINIGANAWIGANAVVMADVGEQATVAAGAVVTRPVADRSQVAGVPARPLRDGRPLALPDPTRRRSSSNAGATQQPAA
jgi:acetyltransferase-like isoleucine patch superfamily enzyme